MFLFISHREKKWEVFAQFCEADCAPASHLFIENQLVGVKWGKKEKSAQMGSSLNGLSGKHFVSVAGE